MNPKAIEVLARQRYDDLAADARGDLLLARADRDADRGPRSGSSGVHRAVLARPWFAAIRRLHSPAREASGGRF
jgi:hypothetical protein